MQNDSHMAINQQQQEQQYQYQQQQYSPGKSPMRAASFPPFPHSEPKMQHSTAILGSPSKMNWSNNSQQYGQQQQNYGTPPFSLNSNNNNNNNMGMDQHAFNTGSFNNGDGIGPAHGSPPKFLTSTAPTYSYSFSNAPSIFETLLRETEQSSMARTGSKFHEAVETLQRLNAEVNTYKVLMARLWKEQQPNALHASTL